MAQRRMFSNRIANSAKFLQMPLESQALYFHLILRADDDGVVESYPVMKLLGSSVDTFKVLQAKGFIQQLNEDQVVIISDWIEHNYIRADRKVDSIYKSLIPESIKLIEPKPRVDVKDNSKRLGGQSTDGIGKVRLGKVREETTPPHKKINYLSEIPETDLKEFNTRFEASPKQIKSKAESLLLYCQSKGKVYKDYKAFLLNALKKDFPERPIKKPEPKEELKQVLTNEQLIELEAKKKEIRELMSKK